MLGCLRGHDKELAPDCRAELSVLLKIAEEYGKDREADAKRFCGGVSAGEGRILQCLKGKPSSPHPRTRERLISRRCGCQTTAEERA